MVANLSRDYISSEDCFWSHSQCYKINSTNQGAWEEGVFPSLFFQCPVFLQSSFISWLFGIFLKRFDATGNRYFPNFFLGMSLFVHIKATNFVC